AQDGVPLPGDVDGVYPALAGGDLRANSDLRHTDGFFSARYARPGGAWVSATASGFQAERGVPVELNESDPRLWRYPDNDRLVTVVAGGLQDVANGLGTADLSLNVGVDIASARIESFALPGDPLGPSADADDFFTTVDETEASDDRTVTARIVGSQNLAAGAVVRAAATYADVRHDEVVTTGLGTGALSENPGSYRQRLWSLGAEAEIPFGLGLGPLDGGRVSLGLAYDGADTPEPGPDVDGTGPPMSDWGGRVGISATAGESLLLHTAVSRRGRFPALRESYSTALGRWHPNPDLQPEVLTAIEAGFTSRFGRYDVQVVGFHQRLDDAIVRGAAPAGASADRMRVNRDRIRSTGVEVLARGEGGVRARDHGGGRGQHPAAGGAGGGGRAGVLGRAVLLDAAAGAGRVRDPRSEHPGGPPALPDLPAAGGAGLPAAPRGRARGRQRRRLGRLRPVRTAAARAHLPAPGPPEVVAAGAAGPSSRRGDGRPTAT
ncbi:MAG: TonB-dependent receptor, partial [Gemmatimonadota bacterium]